LRTPVSRRSTRSSPSAEGRTAQADGEPQAKRELTEADFADVDFDALHARSDYTRFLAKGVPDAIKHKALRKL
jgi:hypothetical protein